MGSLIGFVEHVYQAGYVTCWYDMQKSLNKIKLNLKSIVHACRDYIQEEFTSNNEPKSFDFIEKKLLSGEKINEHEAKLLLHNTKEHWTKDDQIISSSKRILDELGNTDEEFDKEKFNFVMDSLSKDGAELLCLVMFTVLDCKQLFVYKEPKLISRASSSICELIHFARRLEPQTFD